MTGLDTNVLIRFFIQDDPIQGAQASSVMIALSEENQGWIGVAVVMELVWVMTRTYKVSRQSMTVVLADLLSRKEIMVEQQEVVSQAVQKYRTTKAGFADCLIAASARAAGCVELLTFDQDASKTIGMTLVQ